MLQTWNMETWNMEMSSFTFPTMGVLSQVFGKQTFAIAWLCICKRLKKLAQHAGWEHVNKLSIPNTCGKSFYRIIVQCDRHQQHTRQKELKIVVKVGMIRSEQDVLMFYPWVGVEFTQFSRVDIYQNHQKFLPNHLQ